MSRRGGRRSPTGGDREQRLVTWEAVALLGALATLLSGACHGKQAGPPPVCGDGLREGAEACDGTDLGGATCSSEGYVTGTLACTPGCALDRSGCAGRCGDGITQPDEACDGADFRGVTCEALGYVGGALTCTPWCLRSEAACHHCGNGRVDPGEQCDGDDLGGLTCELLTDGVMHGELRCNSDCILHVGGCIPPSTCGNDRVDPGEQCDGDDNLGRQTCAEAYPDLYGGGTLGCRWNCLFDTRDCTPPSPCGNGIAEPEMGEQCDGGDLQDLRCEDLGFERGLLFCLETCAFDFEHCGPAVTCGNGFRDAYEECDGVDVGAATCQDFGFEGGAVGCTMECRLDPSGCNHCGDGVKSYDEQCDGEDVGGVSCGDLGFHGVAPGCRSDCTIDETPCVQAGWCGDGVWQADSHEECDGGDFGQASCRSLGYHGGVLGCFADCTYDTTPCEAVGWCGDRVLQQWAGEECDGLAFGGDTCGGHGFDSGALRCDEQCVLQLDQCGICSNGRCEVGEPGVCLNDCRPQLLAAGGSHTCAVRADRTVWCWGDGPGNGAATSGHGRFAPGPVMGPGGVGTLTGALGVASGSQHSCAVRSDGSVWCWGAGAGGQLGDGLGVDSAAPVQVVLADGSGPLTGAIAVTVGGDYSYLPNGFSCALRFDRTVYCWGDNTKGQLGDASVISRTAAAPVTHVGGVVVFPDVVTVSAGKTHTCAVRVDGTLWCWGASGGGQLGIPSNPNFRVPNQVAALSDVVAVSAGDTHTCAVVQDGSTWCWGGNDQGQLGTGNLSNRYTPVMVPGLGAASQIHAGVLHACALLAAREVWCWGDNQYGQVGDGTRLDRLTPVWVASDVVDLTVGGYHTCIRSAGGAHQCWGANGTGQLGMGTSIIAREPIPVAGGGTYVAVSAFWRRTCAVRVDGTAWCWGSGYTGDGSPGGRFEPVAVLDASGLAPLTEVVDLATGRYHSCASLQDGRLACWGGNARGQLGDGTRTIRETAVHVVGASGTGEFDAVVAVGAGDNHTCAVRSDGGLWCWGDNDKHKLDPLVTTPC